MRVASVNPNVRQEPPCEKWFKFLSHSAEPCIRLFCFPYAGGAASVYADWPALLPREVEVVAVQPPGRSERFGEPVIDRMDGLVARLADAIAPHLDLPYALFGHSFGAKVAYALAHELRGRHLPGPRMLAVAGSSGPSLSVHRPAWSATDEELCDYLRALRGTPQEVLDDPALLSVVLRPLRADMTAAATWAYPDPTALTCAIHAFAGADDAGASAPRMRAWRRETTGPFTLAVVPGGHFVVRDDPGRLLRDLGRELLSSTERPTESPTERKTTP
ncbi:thioesterase [Streptomyces antimycoticus]|uniref:Thioesterase n=1 Tax=Streptomyces antimycoticus TaxID=68175 RepID=A0A499UDL2_9ACTN|nr:thioesterase [Streptomyces antimycoticus]